MNLSHTMRCFKESKDGDRVTRKERERESLNAARETVSARRMPGDGFIRIESMKMEILSYMNVSP